MRRNSIMYAIIETGGKQYRVQPGDVISVEKLNAEAGDEIKFDKVLVMGEGADAEVGTPYLDAAITGKVVENGRGKKVIIYKYKAKKDYRKKQGHRQPYTMVEIIEVGGETAPVKEEPAEEAAPEETEAVEAAAETAEESKEEE
jgi:large subunit ribosomal protein L21